MKIDRKNIIIALALSIFFLVGHYFYRQYKFSKVVYYAKLEKISSSGEARFRWYDTESKNIVDPDNQYSWFWATPRNVPDDPTATNNWVKCLQNNSDSVFKITGIKSKSDCDYWGKDHCVENINIEVIEVARSGF